MTKTQTQNVIKKLMGRKGGLETQKRKLEEKLEELRAKRERLEARIAEALAEPDHFIAEKLQNESAHDKRDAPSDQGRGEKR